MKFLIDNYSSHDNTQPLYLHSATNQIFGNESALRFKEQSLYDAFDKFNPDVYITHAGMISVDLIQYLKENESKNITILISVYGMSQDTINQVDEGIHNNNIPCKFLFSNQDFEAKYNKTFRLLNAADTNISHDKTLDYTLDKAIFVSNENDIKTYDPPYHVISNNLKLQKVVDICSAELYLAGIYNKYKEIIFENLTTNIPQAFYDAIILCDKVYYTTENPQVDEAMDKIFKPEASLNYHNPNKLYNFQQVKKHVQQKHTGLNRLNSLISQLPQAHKEQS